MIKIKYDAELIKIMSLFETVTQAKLKDCFISNDKIFFVVEENQLARAVGKKGINVRKVENILKKRIRIVEYNPNLQRFIINLIYPSRVKNIEENGRVVILSAEDLKTRGYLICRNAQNLREFESIIKRYFDIEELKVV